MPCQPAPPSSHPRSTAAPAVPSRRTVPPARGGTHARPPHSTPPVRPPPPAPRRRPGHGPRPDPPRLRPSRPAEPFPPPEEAPMSVHRIRLHRSAHSASPPAAAPERATAQVRPDLGALLARRLVADRGDVPGWVLITLMTAA